MLFCSNCIDWREGLFHSPILIETGDGNVLSQKVEFGPPYHNLAEESNYVEKQI